ncbi:hypothetical protein CCR75_004951 [Bremia lactucae]|uniref:Uncharacterized protein n=1 Tax=Bremia lactucae TaxID=4779 RepID=A0A976IB36_BRELC|nr:hypothetical protein CCR75_004951 [Bremia lactucae]
MGKFGNDFVTICLLCKHVKRSQSIQRPWREHRKPPARNETLHFVFFHVFYGSTRYLLCELVPCDFLTSAVTTIAVLDSAKQFGLPSIRFKNWLMENVRDRLKVLPTYVPVYTIRVSGTLEQLSCDVLQVMRVLPFGTSLISKLRVSISSCTCQSQPISD